MGKGDGVFKWGRSGGACLIYGLGGGRLFVEGRLLQCRRFSEEIRYVIFPSLREEVDQRILHGYHVDTIEKKPRKSKILTLNNNNNRWWRLILYPNLQGRCFSPE